MRTANCFMIAAAIAFSATPSCGGGDSTTAVGGGNDGGGPDATAPHDAGGGHDGATSGNDGGAGNDGGIPLGDSGAPPLVDAGVCGACPSSYTCGTANGIPVCRAPSGIPLFSNVYVIMMENTSLSTLQPAMTNGTAPNLASLASKYATGSDYHGVAHPSLPNYVALTSGGTQGIGCDCEA